MKAKPRRSDLAYLCVLLIAVFARCALAQELVGHPIDAARMSDAGQYGFLAPVLRDAEVVSLAESIHMTHEFPLVRLGMVGWMHEHLGYDVVAMEGSPEDLWVSQDAFLRDPSRLGESTSGLFGVWNTAEMRRLFAYEKSTWASDDPLYITAYDIQPGTGRSSRGERVFGLLAQALGQYAPAPVDLDVQRWSSDLGLLSDACSRFEPGDSGAVERSIDSLQGWVDRAAPEVDRMYPRLPHGRVLRLIPENLRASLALCQGVRAGGSVTAGVYKRTRDEYAARFALELKQAAPNRKLILWAHASHLFYDADGVGNTSVGEILHGSLGARLYTVGTFAQGGSAIMLFSDWAPEIMGYGRIWGVSRSLKRAFGDRCAGVCFFEVRGMPAAAAVAEPQRVWFEALPVRIALSKDFDGVVWVRTVHPPSMSWREVLAWCNGRYWVMVGVLVGVMGGTLLVAGVVWYRGRHRRLVARR